MASAVDANVLVYASDESSPRWPRAREVVAGLAAGPDLVYVFWPVAMAYLRISTNHRISDRPLSSRQAADNLDQLLRLPHVRTPGERRGFWQLYRAGTEGDEVRGNLVPDAHIATLMRQHGVRTILTPDRDFRRFPWIDVVDPFDGHP